MVTVGYVLLVALLAGQRLVEMQISRRHEAALLARGAVEHARGQMPFMVCLHGAWLVCCVAEVLLLERESSKFVAIGAGLALGAGQVLRLLAIRTLGERWTVKIITLPGEPPVAHGIFRYVRHPNYLGVIIEIAALPMLHGAYLTALTFSVLNALLLRARISAEERALSSSSRDYSEHFRDKPRFLPRSTALHRRTDHA